MIRFESPPNALFPIDRDASVLIVSDADGSVFLFGVLQEEPRQGGHDVAFDEPLQGPGTVADVEATVGDVLDQRFCERQFPGELAQTFAFLQAGQFASGDVTDGFV